MFGLNVTTFAPNVTSFNSNVTSLNSNEASFNSNETAVELEEVHHPTCGLNGCAVPCRRRRSVAFQCRWELVATTMV